MSAKQTLNQVTGCSLMLMEQRGIKLDLLLMFCCTQVDLVVHPSVQPSDDIVTRAIEQVRFKISNSYSAVW